MFLLEKLWRPEFSEEPLPTLPVAVRPAWALRYTSPLPILWFGGLAVSLQAANLHPHDCLDASP